MADIALVTAGRVSLVKGEMGDGDLGPPGVAGEAITAGAPVYRAAATGKYLNSDANAAAPADSVYGIALRTVIAGEPLTVAKGKAIVDGYDLSGVDYGVAVYLSNTVGRLADAAGGTSVVVGRVAPALAVTAVQAATAVDKVLELDL